jgi:hypothetical protein
MTTPELITDEIVSECAEAYHNSGGDIEMALCAAQDDITRLYRNLLHSGRIADAALRGDYHKTDFTEFCENNPITEEDQTNGQ